MPTIRDVAKLAGVSIATVSRVINRIDTVGAPIRERVQQAIVTLGYQPNAVARSLKRDRTYVIGVLLPHMANAFFMHVAKGIEDVVSPEGYSLLMASSDWTPERERHHLQVFFQQQVDAVALISVGGTDPLRSGLLQLAGTPLVLVDRTLPDLKGDSALPDNAGGMRLLVEHLIELGHRRIAMLSGPVAVDSGHERLEGYRSALKRAGIPYVAPLVREAPDFRPEFGQRLALDVLRTELPTALICGNNTLATGALQALGELGLSVPGDLSVAAFGDLDLAPLLKVPLTVCTNSGYDLGRAAGRLLLRRFAQPDARHRHLRTDSQLILRSSTAPPRG